MAVTGTKRRRDEIVVFWIRKRATCAGCGAEVGGGFVRLEGRTPHCLDCADIGHLDYLPRGDAALTRRAAKHSRLRAVVVRWSPARKRYERQGILVEPEALARAEEECLSDADARAARRVREAERRAALDERYVRDFARAVGERYPLAPAGAEDEIAAHACAKHSGRVGRSAAAKSLEPQAVDLAVAAHVRHRLTPYDDYLMMGWDRSDARAGVARQVRDILAAWRGGPGA